MKDIEYRYVPIKRAEKKEDGDMIAEGMAIVYNDETVLFKHVDIEEREVILPGAATESLENDDWRAVWNHQNAVVLGRKSNGTLEINETESGVLVRIHFPDSEEGRSKFESVKRGDVNQMSFAFVPLEEKEERLVMDGVTIYRTTISKMKVYEVSPVTFPAYENTTISSREKQKRDRIIAEASADDQAEASASMRSAELREMEIELLVKE